MQSISSSPARAPGGRFALLVALAMALPVAATAATITVDNPVIGDGTDGFCDLVEAIENANDDAATNDECAAGEGDEVVDEIELTVDVTLDEIQVDTGQTRGGVGLPLIVSAMVIRSDTSVAPEGGVTPRTIERDAGADPFRFFFVGAGGDLTLIDIVLTGGFIHNVPRPNRTLGGAIVNTSTMALTNTTISGNAVRADDYDLAYTYAYGGGIFNLGVLTVTNSTISGNSAYAADDVYPFTMGGGIANGAFEYNQTPTLTLSYSTVSGNTTNSVGGEFAVSVGAGLYDDSTLDVVNSTLSNNTVQAYGTTYAGAYGGALGVGGLGVDAGVATLTHSTVASNVKIDGPVMYPYGAALQQFSTDATLTLYGSLVGFSTGGDNCGIQGVTDGGENLADDDSCGTIPDTLEGLDPVLAGNGGPTRTHRMTSTSNARDLGGVCGLDDDQRGVDRTIDGLCDSGSYEFFCNAPDEDVVLADDLLLIERTVEVCGMITGGPDYEVGDGGNLIARAGSKVVLENGFEVTTGGRMSVEIDPGIQMPDPADQGHPSVSAVPARPAEGR